MSPTFFGQGNLMYVQDKSISIHWQVEGLFMAAYRRMRGGMRQGGGINGEMSGRRQWYVEGLFMITYWPKGYIAGCNRCQKVQVSSREQKKVVRGALPLWCLRFELITNTIIITNNATTPATAVLQYHHHHHQQTKNTSARASPVSVAVIVLLFH